MRSQFLQIHDFSKSTLGIGSVSESIKALFKCYNLACLSIYCFPYNAISLRKRSARNTCNEAETSTYSFADFLDELIFARDMLVDFFLHLVALEIGIYIARIKIR